jgi:hypothetical protein
LLRIDGQYYQPVSQIGGQPIETQWQRLVMPAATSGEFVKVAEFTDSTNILAIEGSIPDDEGSFVQVNAGAGLRVRIRNGEVQVQNSLAAVAGNIGYVKIQYLREVSEPSSFARR